MTSSNYKAIGLGAVFAAFATFATPAFAANTCSDGKTITDGKGVNVVYDGVGKDTFEASLNSLAPLGMFVSFGNASGNAPSVAPHDLQNRGSLFFTRPSLAHYSATSEDLQSLADAFFEVIGNGAVNIHINQRYPLADLVQAHSDLESRKTTGSTILIP